MVKTKKMSVSTIIAIVLALLLAISVAVGISGAWFTDKDSAGSAAAPNLKFGHVGNVTVSVTGSADANAEAKTRGYLMPGDTVTAQGLSLSYNEGNATGAEGTVWYLIADGTNFYTVKDNALVQVLKAASGSAKAYGDTSNAGSGQITDGTPITVTASTVYVSDGTTPVAVTSANAASLTNAYQDKSLTATGVGFVQGGKTYTVGIIQQANLTAGAAYDILSTMLDTGTLVVAQ